MSLGFGVRFKLTIDINIESHPRVVCVAMWVRGGFLTLMIVHWVRVMVETSWPGGAATSLPRQWMVTNISVSYIHIQCFRKIYSKPYTTKP